MICTTKSITENTYYNLAVFKNLYFFLYTLTLYKDGAKLGQNKNVTICIIALLISGKNKQYLLTK